MDVIRLKPSRAQGQVRDSYCLLSGHIKSTLSISQQMSL